MGVSNNWLKYIEYLSFGNNIAEVPPYYDGYFT